MAETTSQEGSAPGAMVPGYLFVLPWYPESPIGGVNQAMLHLIDLMNQAGKYRPFLLVPFGPLNPPCAPHLKCPVLSLPVRSPILPGHPLRAPIAFLATLPWTLWKLRAIAQVRQIQVINFIFPDLQGLAFVLLRKLGLFQGKVVLTLQGNDIKVALDETGLGRWLVRSMFRWADRVVACSNGLREDLLRLEPRCERNSLVIHNSIDIEAFRSMAPAGREIPASIRNRRFLLNIGKYEHKKGQDVLIRAFEQISADFPDVLLVVMGQTGPDIARIREMAASSPVASRILLLENVAHEMVPVFLREALVFVLPSRREGLPFAILEAAACGKPVVAAAATGVPELIRDRITGLLVPVDDDKALARAIADMLGDPALRTRLASSLHALVRENFTWQKAYERYTGL